MLTVTGRDAMRIMWREFEETPVENRTIQIAAPFRKFAWMLDSSQRMQIDSLVASGIASYQASFLKAPICDAPASKVGALSSSSGTGSAASSSSCSAIMKPIFVIDAKAGQKGPVTDGIKSAKAALLAMYKK
jgi:hypothetical protein